jgi:superfamily I DNA/RNA helicase
MSTPSTTDFPLLPEQEAIRQEVHSGSGSLDVDALAGAGKSTVLRKSAPGVRDRALALAFNKSIADTLKTLMPANFDVKTFNGLGHSAWAKVLSGRKINLQASKAYRVIRDICAKHGIADGNAGQEDRDDITAFVNGARNLGLVPGDCRYGHKKFYPDNFEGWSAVADVFDLDLNTTIYETKVAIAREILNELILQSFQGLIDFADQIYMSCCFGGTFTKYPVLFGDEIQDLSALNHYMVERSLSPGGRFIGVGDERQSIYAFRGADSTSIPKLREKFSTKTMQLSTTFRCAQSIVANSHWHAPHMCAAPWAKEGEVKHLGDRWTLESLVPGSAIICRNNAPLFSMAFALIAAGISVTMLGKEMSKTLINFVAKMANKDPNASVELVLRNVEEWRAKEMAMAQARDNFSRMERVANQADVIRALPGRTAQEMMDAVEKVFSENHGRITLTSGHKSKGLEWDHVYHLDAHLIPGRFAKTPGQQLQEKNLKYVIETRPKSALHFIRSRQPQGEVE